MSPEDNLKRKIENSRISEFDMRKYSTEMSSRIQRNKWNLSNDNNLSRLTSPTYGFQTTDIDS